MVSSNKQKKWFKNPNGFHSAINKEIANNNDEVVFFRYVEKIIALIESFKEINNIISLLKEKSIFNFLMKKKKLKSKFLYDYNNNYMIEVFQKLTFKIRFS